MIEQEIGRIEFGEFGHIEVQAEHEFMDELFIQLFEVPCIKDRIARQMFEPKIKVENQQ